MTVTQSFFNRESLLFTVSLLCFPWELSPPFKNCVDKCTVLLENVCWVVHQKCDKITSVDWWKKRNFEKPSRAQLEATAATLEQNLKLKEYYPGVGKLELKKKKVQLVSKKNFREGARTTGAHMHSSLRI